MRFEASAGGDMEEWPFARYEWARSLAIEIVGEDKEVSIRRVVSISPSPDRNVTLEIIDKATGYKATLALESSDRVIADDEEGREGVRKWSTSVKSELESRRQLFGL